jgi:hypothetical protein
MSTRLWRASPSGLVIALVPLTESIAHEIVSSCSQLLSRSLTEKS